MGVGVGLPSGTVTFLFTDIEGSTRLWEAFGDVMGVALARHDEIVRAAIETHGGVVFATGGDGFAAAFGRSVDAVTAAISAQGALQGEVWVDGVVLRVRMGVHTGEAEERGGDYFGPPVNRAARLMSAAHGGQVVLSETTVGVLESVEGVRWVDLGVHRLKGVADEMRVFGVDADGLGWLDRGLVTEQVTLGNLPRPVSEYVGRIDLLQDRAEELSQQRLVTLTGTGGVGKTRTAVEAGWLVGDSFPDGAWMIELAAVTDEAMVVPAVASAFGVQPQPAISLLASVVEWLQARRLLLVLDNCEHVLGPVVELVSAITQRCESVTVLATSREPLGVAGEQVIPIQSLEVDNAVELFMDRAHAADASLDFSADDRTVITEICSRLDGIALAIELAATRVRSMSPTQIRDRLDERFRLLTGSRRSIERHQTLRHTVQWSYDLLDPTEQRVLGQMSVFAGGFTLSAATAVAGDGMDEFEMLDVLDSLVAKSLLHVDRSDTDVRYGMLETIRQFAEEALAATGDSDASRDRHADFFAEHAEANVEVLWSEQEPLAYRWVQAEIANLSAAFRWSADREHVDPATRIATWAQPVASNCLRIETFGWAEEMVALARASRHRQLPGLLASACDSAAVYGRMDEAVGYGLEAIALHDNPHYEPSWWAYHRAGFALFFNDEVDKALSVWRVGAERPDDEPVRGNLAFLHLFSAFSLVDLSEGEPSNAFARIVASSVPTVRALGVWIRAALAAQHDVAEAIVLYQQAIDMLVDCGGRSAEQTCRGFLTGLLAQTNDIGSALAGFTTLVNQWASTGGIYTDTGIGQLVETLARLGYHDGATQLLGALQWPWIESQPEALAMREAMDPEAFAIAYDTGSALDRTSTAQLAHKLIAQARHDLEAT